jgi:hypothetical protein
MAEIIPLPDSFAALLRWIEVGAMDVELAQRAGWITSSDPLKLTDLGRAALAAYDAEQLRTIQLEAMRECFHAVYPIGMEASEEIGQLMDKEDASS